MGKSPNRPVLAVTLALAAACAAAPRAETAPARGVDAEGAIAAWEGRHSADASPDGAGGEASGPASPRGASPSARRAIPAEGRATSAPPRVVDARFRGADVHDALRFLADVAGLSLVVADDVTGVVDLELRQVDAIEAMRIVAETKGAEIELRDGVVHVTAREPP